MTTEKNGNGILIYETINEHLFQRQYNGYSLSEAKKLFKKEAKRQKEKN